MRFLIVLLAFTAITAAAAAEKSCEYAGLSFSTGATMCECPSLVGEGGLASGGAAHVTSRRLLCGTEGWVVTSPACVDLDYKHSSASATDDMDKYNTQYCPRLPVNYPELQKAITQETDRYIATAPKSSIVPMIEAICRRFKLDAPCKAMLGAIGGLEQSK